MDNSISNDFIVNLVCWVVALGLGIFFIAVGWNVMLIKREARAIRKLFIYMAVKQGVEKEVIAKILKEIDAGWLE